MTTFVRLSRSVVVAIGFWGCAHLPAARSDPSSKWLAPQARLAIISRAQVWQPTAIARMDLRRGPQGGDAFAPNEMVTCEYVEEKLQGRSRKFTCSIGPDNAIKVKYGPLNGEVHGEVLTTRLLWALGFGADHMYPVRVTCRGCSADPFKDAGRRPGGATFDPAAAERKFPGKELEEKPDSGWHWSELDLVDEKKGGAPRAHVDALKLLAVLLQHTDSKPAQQRLICLTGGEVGNGGCNRPFMMLNDVGLTFGKTSFTNANLTSSVSFDNWLAASIWKDPAACVGNLSKSFSGSLRDPRISEAGRLFLAGLLEQLSDRQLHDLFDVAQVERRSRRPGTSAPAASVDEWVEAFKRKRAEIVATRCPA